MAQLCTYSDMYLTNNASIVLISFGSTLGVSRWLDEICKKFDKLIDPERSVYYAYGLDHSLLRSWSLKTVVKYARFYWEVGDGVASQETAGNLVVSLSSIKIGSSNMFIEA